MFEFLKSKKSLAGSGFLQGFSDYHCHLLPGVDDGVRVEEHTFQLLADMERAGMRAVWFTPHIMEDVPNETTQLRARFERIQAAYNGRMQLHLAAEYMLDSLFGKRLAEKDLLLHGDNELLVETSYTNPPYNMDDLLKRVRAMGITPILAHPERYRYIELDEYAGMKEQPIRFQLNLGSLMGDYGLMAKKKAEYLLKNGLYDCLGSDTHHKPFWEHLVSAKRLSAVTLERLERIKASMD